jgi:predicted HAD superfamily Cof-like phosphohydrolase
VKSKHQKRVEEMMVLAGQDVPRGPVVPAPEVRLLRARLILEEALEAVEALGCSVYVDDKYLDSRWLDVEVCYRIEPDLTEIAKECADLSVVTIGTLSACGIADKALLKEVDLNNLAKFGPGGYRRDDGKWIKPPNHPKPEIARILEQQES